MIGFWFLFKRETKRFFVIIHQAMTPAIVSALLYFVVFGQAIGNRIGNINGSDYLNFIVPGLIMLNAIITTYTTTSMSIFMSRRFNSIDDLLIAPISYTQMVLAFVLAGLVRGVLISVAIFLLALFFIHPQIHSYFWMIFYILIVNFLFSSLGIIFGLLTDEFENIGLLTTFFLTPLTFLGGVFYSTQMLPPLFQKLSAYNPVLYMVDGLRYGMLGIHDTNLGLNLVIVIGLTILVFAVAVWMFSIGYKLKS